MAEGSNYDYLFKVGQILLLHTPWTVAKGHMISRLYSLETLVSENRAYCQYICIKRPL